MERIKDLHSAQGSVNYGQHRVCKELRLAENDLKVHGRVRVPDGREGVVVGFYSREPEEVLVSFGDDVAEVFPVSEVEHLP